MCLRVGLTYFMPCQLLEIHYPEDYPKVALVKLPLKVAYHILTVQTNRKKLFWVLEIDPCKNLIKEVFHSFCLSTFLALSVYSQSPTGKGHSKWCQILTFS